MNKIRTNSLDSLAAHSLDWVKLILHHSIFISSQWLDLSFIKPKVQASFINYKRSFQTEGWKWAKAFWKSYYYSFVHSFLSNSRVLLESLSKRAKQKIWPAIVSIDAIIFQVVTYQRNTAHGPIKHCWRNFAIFWSNHFAWTTHAKFCIMSAQY